VGSVAARPGREAAQAEARANQEGVPFRQGEVARHESLSPSLYRNRIPQFRHFLWLILWPR
jgi:hypothetical protein